MVNSGSSHAQIHRQIAVAQTAKNTNANVGYVADRLTLARPAVDQQRVATGGSFRAAERFSLPRFHKAVIQLAASDPHC